MAKYFAASEFVRRSHRPLKLREQTKAETWGRRLDPVREIMGPITVTSFVRNGPGSHADGSAVDIQLTFGTNKQIRKLADLVAAMYLRTGELAQVIYEAPEKGQLRAHVHLADRLVPGAVGGYLLDLEGNRKYARAPIPDLPAARAAAAKTVPVPAVAAVSALALLSLARTLGVRLPGWVP